MCSQLLWVLCVLVQVLEHVCLIGQELPVPYELKANAVGWSLSVTWKGPSYSYEVQVLQEDNTTPIHHVSLGNLTYTMNQDAVSQSVTLHHWKWISPLPLNCVSHRVRVRSRSERHTSQWSYINVTDTPEDWKVYPTEAVVLVGSQVSFCCVMKKGMKQDFLSFTFDNVMMKPRWIRDNVAVIDVPNLKATTFMGITIQCSNGPEYTGSTVFVGYPPKDDDLQCETDLQSVTCSWRKINDTSLWGDLDTTYTLNGSRCTGSKISQCKLPGRPASGKRSWVLAAENPLGSEVLIHKVDLSQRVVLQAPQQLKISECSTRSAKVSWQWNPSEYVNFEVQCEVNLSYSTDDGEIRPLPTYPPPRTYSRVSHSQLSLEDLLPATQYHLKVRCGKQKNFWKWSSWSSASFRTSEDHPDTPDLWFRRDSNETLYIMWKPVSWSNGWLTEYSVTWTKLIDGMEQTAKVKPSQAIFNLGHHHHAVRVTVTAFNSAGSSPPAVIVLPGRQGDHVPTISRVSGADGRFELSWSPHNSTTCGYVVEWHPARIKKDVEWLKVPAGQTHARVESASFVPGEKYILTIYSCQASLELLERKEGYIQELVPAAPVQNLEVKTEGADTVVSWGRIPPESQRGFIRGYIIECDPPDVQKVNVNDPDVLEYRFPGLPPKLYKFTVTAYTQAGESEPRDASIDIPVDGHMVLVMIFITIAVISCLLVFIVVICCRYRRWLKVIFYSEVPQPKISNEWLTEKGVLLMVMKPCNHDQLHIVEKQHKTAKLKLNREMSFLEETHYSCLQVQNPSRQGLSGQLHVEPTRRPETPPSGRVHPSINPVSNEITYTKIQTILEVLDMSPQGPEPQMDAPSLGPLSALPTSMGSYLPQTASEDDTPPTEDHLDRPVFSNPNLSSYSIPPPCSFLSNPTYCPTFPAQFSSPL